jgi:hypothetical protein
MNSLAIILLFVQLAISKMIIKSVIFFMIKCKEKTTTKSCGFF